MANWYNECDKCCNAVSTRIRLARNIKGMPFPSSMTEKQRVELLERVKHAIRQADEGILKSLKYIDMADIPENEVRAMVERHVISPEFAVSTRRRGIVLNGDESICIMVGEEDHIRIQVIMSGLSLREAYLKADELDSSLNRALDFAFDSELGYLTQCPTNLGTGMRASVMLHLPMLHNKNQLRALSDTVGKIGFTVRGLYGEGSKAAACLYQVSNQITLGIDEKTALDNLTLISEQLILKEREAVGSANKIALEDKACRALGILSTARLLNSNEMADLISLIKLGCEMGIIEREINPIKVLIEASPFMLMKKYGSLTSEERDIKRAEFIREYFKV